MLFYFTTTLSTLININIKYNLLLHSLLQLQPLQFQFYFSTFTQMYAKNKNKEGLLTNNKKMITQETGEILGEIERPSEF
jgi:hypothetical protein